MALGGIGLGIAYTETVRMLQDPETPLRVKVDLAKHLEKMDMKRLELAVGLAKSRKKTNEDVSVEQAIQEVEAEVLSSE